MLPLLLFTTALILAGCGESLSREPDNPKEPLPKLIPHADPRFEEVREVLQNAYQITENELNVGCHLIDYSQPGTQEKILSYGGEILPCEVSEYVLDRYEKYPDLARKLVGGPIPWSLDDGDPSTDFDEKIQSKVKAAFNRLDPLLRQSGLLSNSAAYQERLAVALFYFVDFPEDPEIAKQKADFYWERTQELTSLGLKDFQDYLFKQGGLGTSLITEDADLEATALEALRSRRGYCTEKSRILYAVYRMAGLDPFFVMGKGRDLERYFRKRGMTVGASLDSGHQYLGLSWPQKARYFDPTILNSDAQYPNPYRERLTHALSWYFNNRGVDLAQKNRYGESLRSFYLSLQFHPNNSMALVNLDSLYLESKQFPLALSAGFEAWDRTPNDPTVAYTLGRTYWQMEYFNTALKWVDRSQALDPSDPDGYVLKGYVLLSLEKYPDAVTEFSKALELRADWASPHIGLGKTYIRQGKVEEAAAAFQQAYQLEPHNPDVLFPLGLCLIALDKKSIALPMLTEALKLKPDHILAAAAQKALSELP